MKSGGCSIPTSRDRAQSLVECIDGALGGEHVDDAEPLLSLSGDVDEESVERQIRRLWGPRTPYVGDWPTRPDIRTTGSVERWVPSVYVLCSTGCGMDIGIADGRLVGVRGRITDRVSHGQLGPKGLHGWEAIQHPRTGDRS